MKSKFDILITKINLKLGNLVNKNQIIASGINLKSDKPVDIRSLTNGRIVSLPKREVFKQGFTLYRLSIVKDNMEEKI
ncbi:MAG: hypothetical protein AAB546_03605 [Patescibacteria group bacterium]